MSSLALLKTLDRPLGALLEPFARGGALLGGGKKSSFREDTLILRPGGLGDLVCCHLALEYLGQNPRDFFWLVERRSAPWARSHALPHLCYDRDLRAVLATFGGRWPRVINTEQFFGLAQTMALFCRAPGGQVFSFATNRGSRTSDATVPYSQNREHESLLFAHLFGRALAISSPTAVPEIPRRAPSAGHGLMALGGGGAPSRSFPPEFWISLARAYGGGLPLVLSGGRGEGTLLEVLRTAMPGARVLPPSFEAFEETVQRAERVITVDSGAVHVASYHGVPTVAVFSSGQERKWAPLGAGSVILTNPGAPCRPCALWGQIPPCPHGFVCQEITLPEGSPKTEAQEEALRAEPEP